MLRFTLKGVDKETGLISNLMSTNDENQAMAFENKAIAIWGKENVWICDNIQEIMVG